MTRRDEVRHFGPAYQILYNAIRELENHPERADEVCRVIAEYLNRRFHEWHQSRLKEYGYELRYNDNDGGSAYLVAIKPDQDPDDAKWYNVPCKKCQQRRGDHIMGRCPDWEFQ
jgi:hypothetical protein